MGTLDDYRKRPHWSYSSLNGLLNICSLQWAFDHVYQKPKTFTPVSLAFGNVYHRVMEWISMSRMEHNLPSPESAADMFADLWSRQLAETPDIRFNEETTADTCADQGRGLVSCVIANLDPAEEVLAINQAFAIPLIDAAGEMLEKPLIGEIDCVVRAKRVKTIVDWKTSAKKWSKNKAKGDLQATAFCHAYRELHGENVPFRFEVVTKTKTPAFEAHETRRDPDSGVRLVEFAKIAEKLVNSEAFYPNEQSFYCGSCPHTEACQKWHREAARRTVTMAA